MAPGNLPPTLCSGGGCGHPLVMAAHFKGSDGEERGQCQSRASRSGELGLGGYLLNQGSGL